MREMCNTHQLGADATAAEEKKEKPQLAKLSRRSRRVCRRLGRISEFQAIRKQTNQTSNWARLLGWDIRVYKRQCICGQKVCRKIQHSHRVSWPNLATNLQQPSRQEKIHFQMLPAIFIYKYLWFSVSGYDLNTPQEW